MTDINFIRPCGVVVVVCHQCMSVRVFECAFTVFVSIESSMLVMYCSVCYV